MALFFGCPIVAWAGLAPLCKVHGFAALVQVYPARWLDWPPHTVCGLRMIIEIDAASVHAHHHHDDHHKLHSIPGTVINLQYMHVEEQRRSRTYIDVGGFSKFPELMCSGVQSILERTNEVLTV